ncbi:TM1812 family CRISPR-associated protein [Ileibacterium valens]|uniref:TM1812 family CRISPR-associated protein n=1 Tax=Ileibacterium valens TaxID=1862668 RepID=UPI0035147F20
MQYFTFLGMGKDGKYNDLLTSFKEEELSLKTPFVQEAIYKKHKSQINEVCIFLTPKARELTYPVFKERFSEWPVTIIDISDNCSFEEFIPLLIENIRDEKIIVDVTHCFRSIPIRLLMAMTYAEQMKNTKIDHIYYGQMFSDPRQEVVIEDIIKDYQLQKVSVYLSEFNDTLAISSSNWEIAAEQNKEIKRFLKAMTDFNRMIELCEFANAVKCVTNIVRQAKNIRNKPDQYTLLVPMVNKIIDKLEKCTEGSLRHQKAELIRLLLKHRKYQIAATFTDQFFREELIGKLVLKRGIASFEELMDEYPFLRHYEDSFAYKFSQYLMNCELAMDGSNKKDNSGVEQKFNRLFDRGLFNQQDIDQLYNRFDVEADREAVNNFFKNYRNKLNHGQSIQDSKGLEEIIYKVLDITESL